MKIKISEDMAKEEFYAIGEETRIIMGRDKQQPDILVASVSDPVLLTDNEKIFKLPFIERETVFRLFQCFPRITEYDGVAVSWDPSIHVDVWGPSIDTIFFARHLKASGILGTGLKSVVEIGCGSGFLAKYISKKCEVDKLVVIDICPYAIKCARENIGFENAEFLTGDATQLEFEKADLVICNPPYIPRQRPVVKNQFEGLSLIREILLNAERYITDEGALIFNYSSVGEELVKKYLAEATKKGLKIERIGSMKVPFKIITVLNNKEWMDYLIQNKMVEKKGPCYWHELNLIKVTKGVKK